MATMMPVKRTRWMLLREPSRICAPEISVEAAIVPATVTRAADNAAGQRLRDVYVDRTLGSRPQLTGGSTGGFG